MGHVDHGKTTLLDRIRKTNVANTEAGGITQSIGAYEIIHQPQIHEDQSGRNSANKNQRTSSSVEGRRITFIDTPGHEAFSAMRTRGAHIADLAVLVVAADEGVKPQTKEAIEILTKTKTPFTVAITKIDKPEANIERTKNDLAANGVMLEGYGGQISYQPLSAKTGEGITELLDHILLVAEVEGFNFNPSAPARGYVLETKMDRRRGLEVTVILKDGTLRRGEMICTKTAKGKVKILENFRGEAVDELMPSSPARIFGFETMPLSGEEFIAGDEIKTEVTAKDNALKSAPSAASAASAEAKLRLLLKASDAGSLEALGQALRAMDKCGFAVLAEGLGDVSDGDVKFALASDALIIGFKVKILPAAKNLAESNRVKIITSNVIYELVKATEELLAPPQEAEPASELEVLAVFNQKKLEKQIVGGRVIKGAMRIKAAFEIKRNEENVGRGRILSLEEQKKETNEVKEGKECGLLVNSQVAIQPGDRLIIVK